MSRLRRGPGLLLLAAAGTLALLTSTAISQTRNAPPPIGLLSSDNPTNTTNRTLKSGTPGCSCHGATAATSINVSLSSASGVTQLYPGDFGFFRINVSKAGAPSTTPFGFNAAASDAVTALAVVAGQSSQTATVGGVPELTHTSAHKTLAQGFYQFKYTMPATATTGSSHTIYGTAGGPTIGGWNHASNKVITTKALPAAPATLSAGTPTGSTVPLNWSGGGPQYKVLRKTGDYPSSPTDVFATTVYEGSGMSTTATGLTGSTLYYFRVFSKDVGPDSGASFFSTASAQTTAMTTASNSPNPWVDAVNGNDANAGTSDAPVKTIKQAIINAGSNPTITVRPGTYNMALGETFPIEPSSNTKLISTGGAAVTIIDATGADTRVIYGNGLGPQTLIEGFTIRGGMYLEEVGGNAATGGGIFLGIGDQTTVNRCIITNNEVRGHYGDSNHKTGGPAYGGGIGIFNALTKVTNSVISNNIVRGGTGYNEFEMGVSGGTGGSAQGGGIWMSGPTPMFNNTFVGNQSIGGEGGTAENGVGGTGGTALYGALDAGSITATNNIFASNVVTAGVGGVGSSGNGSAGGAVSGGINVDTASYNLFFNNTAGDGFTGTNAIIGQNPLFVSGSDFHLRTASPARGAGTATGAPLVDLENLVRPSPPSMGAYEVGLFLAATGGIGKITVTWPGVSGSTSHNLYMARVSGVTPANYASLAGGAKVTGATSPYVLSPVPNGTTYYFVLTAIEQGIEGPASPQVSAAASAGWWVKSVPVIGSNFTNITRDLANGNTLYASANDAVGVYKSTNGGDTWTALSGAINGRDIRAVAASGTSVFAATKDGDILRSTNSGTTWDVVADGVDVGETVKSVAIDPLATNIVYAGDFQLNAVTRIIRSTDGGTSWVDLPTGAAAAYVLQVDPVTSGTVWAAGTGTPNVIKSLNGFQQYTDEEPAAGLAYALALAPSAPNTLYCAIEDAGIYKTTDGAATSWVLKNNGLGMTPPSIAALLVDTNNANRVHAGTESGYYTTTDGGDNWALGPATGPHPSATLIFNAFAQTANGRLVGTTSDAIYILALSASPAITSIGPVSAGSTAGGDARTINGSGFVAATGLRVLFDGIDATVNLGASTASSIAVTTPAHATATVDVTVINPDGQAVTSASAFLFSNCTFAISTGVANYASTASSGTVSVTAPAGCGWSSSVPGGSFVSLTGGSPGTGNGTVSYNVAQNATGAARTTTLTIAGQPFEVTQSASGVGTFALTAAASPSQVAVNWGAATGASSYEVRRRSGGGAWNLVMTTAGLTHNDTTVAAGTGYLYRIHAMSGSAIIAYSNIDLAVPFAYTDATITAGSTTVKAAHFNELRQAANAARASLGLAPATFTGTISAGSLVLRIHLIEIRAAIDAVRAAVGMSAASYTDGTVTAGVTPIRAVHIQNVRTAVQ
jgi:hypothetical protein